MNWLTRFSHALGLTVVKTRRYEQVHLEQKRMSVINEITKIINSNLDLPQVYKSFAEKIKELIDYDRCLIVLLPDDGKGANVFLIATPNETKLPKGLPISLTGTGAEWVLRHGSAQFENDLLKERMFAGDELLVQEGIRSVARIPLRTKDKIIGIFILQSRKPSLYHGGDLCTLEPIVEHLALSLERYFLFRQITTLSMTDELTECGNRRMLNKEMEREIRRAERYGRTLGLLMVDIDRFKRINDSYGHLAGDTILKDLASLVRDNVRDIDTCIRYGGEEFLVILPETDTDGAVAAAEKIRKMVEGYVFYIGENIERITVSVGIAVFPMHGVSGQELIERADAALYRAKKEGRNRSYLCGEGVIEMESLFKELETVT